MNKTLIRVCAAVILISPWIYIGETLKDVAYILLAIIVLIGTVDITKKKKEDRVIDVV